jgi:putative ABC transport system permease protein
VFEEKGSGGFFDMDEFIFVPIETLQKKIMGIDHVLMVFNIVDNPDQIERIADDMAITMRDRHEITDPDKEDFAITTTKEALETLDTVFGAISLLLIALASISLVVGGVGIMNIMYVSVAERTYEIGLRKAVGALARYILWQFLWEAVGVTLLGAIIGIIFGLGLSKLISIIAISQGFDLPFIFVPSALVIACGVAIGIGLFFGVFPARQASKMDPVTALRSGG